MYSYEFHYFPGRYLNYSEFSQIVSELRTIASYEGISIDSPAREYLKDKIVVVARKNRRAVAFRIAEFIKVPKNIPVLFVHNSVSLPSVFKKDLSYNMLYTIANNLVFRFRIFENTYICCINDNFFDAQRFEADFSDVFPSITQTTGSERSYINVIEYLISNRTELFGIYDSSEIDRQTYFINNERLIQIGRANIIKCISNIFRGRSYKRTGRQFLTPDKNANAA